MTDIDFDELDRAVNSIMSGNGRNVPPSAVTIAHDDDPLVKPTNTSRESVSASDAAVQSSEAPITSHEEVAGQQVVAVTTDGVPPASAVENLVNATPLQPELPKQSAASSVVPARRGGQFMDVVRPAAIRGSRSTPSSSRTVSRNASTIEPLAASHPAPDLGELDALLKTDANETSSVASMSVESPFLTDAKVDKRPLGSEPSRTTVDNSAEDASSVAVPVTVQATSSTEKSDTNDSDKEIMDAVAEKQRRAAMPAELTPDLLSIESSTPEDDARQQPTQVVQPQPSPRPVASSQSSMRPSQPTASPVSAGSIAIQPQYQQSPSKTDAEEVSSIYDTASYHQPLAHPEKKKAGWSWVVWVLGLLVLGAGGGALAYYLLIQ